MPASIIPRLSLRQKITLTSLGLMVALAVVLVAALSATQRNTLMDNAQEMQRVTLRVLAQNMATEFPALRYEKNADGTVARVVWDQIPDFENHGLVDAVGAQTGKTTTIFRLDPEKQQFVRVSTNVMRPDGTRAVGTPLDPTGPVHAAMLRAETYSGEATILGSEYLTIYLPVHDLAGKVHGVLYAGVPIDAIQHVLSDNLKLATLITIGLLAAACLLNLLMTRRALRPLAAIDAAMQDVAAQRYDRAIPATGMHDEIGSIARNLEGFRDRLAAAATERQHANAQREAAAAMTDAQIRKQTRIVADITAGLERLAKGDLTVRIPSPPHDPFPQEYEALRGTFNEVVGNLGGMMTRIVDVAQQVQGSAEEITSAAQHLAGRAETQAATLEQSAAALNELTASVQSAAGMARSAEEASVENRTIAEAGQAIVGDAIEAMQRIERSADQIGRIIGVIDDIAFQTNLLALNAGVEAARAGEAGRGFAVVASEVRGLAQRAAESASEIKGLILESGQHVKAGSSLVMRSGASLEQMLHKARTASEQIAGIAAAATDQAVALREINTGVDQLDNVTQQNASLAEETRAAAQFLRQQAELLNSDLGRFMLQPAVPAASRPGPETRQAASALPAQLPGTRRSA